MNSFSTIEEARAYAETLGTSVSCIIEIVPGKPGVKPYIGSKASLAALQAALRKKPMPEIKALIRVAVDLQAERDAAAEARLNRNVPGLAELRAVIEAHDRYDGQFARMMEDEHNDGANPPRPVKTDGAAVAEKYPIAAAYIKAENWACAQNHVKANAGSVALRKIGNGEDSNAAIAEMEATWQKYIDARIWD